jgi:hypothetical protein
MPHEGHIEGGGGDGGELPAAQKGGTAEHAYPLIAGRSGHGTRRFATPTDSVAAARSNVAPEMFRAITRTVLFDHTAALSSMNRVDDTSDACARSPARAPLIVTSISAVAPGARLGRSQDTSAAKSRRP